MASEPLSWRNTLIEIPEVNSDEQRLTTLEHRQHELKKGQQELKLQMLELKDMMSQILSRLTSEKGKENLNPNSCNTPSVQHLRDVSMATDKMCDNGGENFSKSQFQIPKVGSSAAEIKSICNDCKVVMNEDLDEDELSIFQLFDEMPNQTKVCGMICEILNDEQEEDSLDIYQVFDKMSQKQSENCGSVLLDVLSPVYVKFDKSSQPSLESKCMSIDCFARIMFNEDHLKFISEKRQVRWHPEMLPPPPKPPDMTSYRGLRWKTEVKHPSKLSLDGARHGIPSRVEEEVTNQLADGYRWSLALHGAVTCSMVNEYLVVWDKRQGFVSGLYDTVGLALIMTNEALLWTNGQYFLQTEKQFSKQWKLMHKGDDPNIDILVDDNIPKDAAVGVDIWCVSVETAQRWEHTFAKKQQKLIQTIKSLVFEVWLSRIPAKINLILVHQVFHPLEFVCCSVEEKLPGLREKLVKRKACAIIITASDEVVGLYDICGAALAHSPVVHAFSIVTLASTFAYVKRRKLSYGVRSYMEANGIEVWNYSAGHSDIALLASHQTPLLSLAKALKEAITCFQIQSTDFKLLQKQSGSTVDINLKLEHIQQYEACLPPATMATWFHHTQIFIGCQHQKSFSLGCFLIVLRTRLFKGGVMLELVLVLSSIVVNN